MERGKLILYSHSFRPTRPLYEIDSTLVAFGTTFLYKLQMISGYCTVSWKIRHGIRNSIGLKGTETKKNKEIEDRKCLLNLSKKKTGRLRWLGKKCLAQGERRLVNEPFHIPMGAGQEAAKHPSSCLEELKRSTMSTQIMAHGPYGDR